MRRGAEGNEALAGEDQAEIARVMLSLLTCAVAVQAKLTGHQVALPMGLNLLMVTSGGVLPVHFEHWCLGVPAPSLAATFERRVSTITVGDVLVKLEHACHRASFLRKWCRFEQEAAAAAACSW
ncbi:hypothetical protein [Knoellia aerolata]|uniref:hypothetical protein n=1 Tax=Knoellia aerolata TaxID=442954 RepID=UPI0012EDBDF4|nr:hypothetical protein [Knoellia aerolata]